eukprot:CAMPEP_0206041744 /NCGR_PEP_ID=MMETSP1466-20131121/6144_1 /ASSEMBLY_ACC=CAM_ASM_001126 /TAXON_ID=44452 /ORGANISM="Pavlova gyrans, Strain CCMP608" /LENGTH=597 /DNA_ID=CAMNT_0053416447 /DNA_START=116 /DNA_END=1905 /DNA_ORIENTATION=-
MLSRWRRQPPASVHPASGDTQAQEHLHESGDSEPGADDVDIEEIDRRTYSFGLLVRRVATGTPDQASALVRADGGILRACVAAVEKEPAADDGGMLAFVVHFIADLVHCAECADPAHRDRSQRRVLAKHLGLVRVRARRAVEEENQRHTLSDESPDEARSPDGASGGARERTARDGSVAELASQRASGGPSPDGRRHRSSEGMVTSATAWASVGLRHNRVLSFTEAEGGDGDGPNGAAVSAAAAARGSALPAGLADRLTSQEAERWEAMIDAALAARSAAPFEALEKALLEELAHRVLPAVTQSQAFAALISARVAERARAVPTLDDFSIHDRLGVGGSGLVLLATHRASGRLYALKVISKLQVARLRLSAAIYRERQALRVTNHPCVIRAKWLFQTPTLLCICMEWLPGGNMYRDIKAHGPYPPQITRLYAAQIILALDHLHGHGLLYRDLKPDNVLLGPHGRCVLTDLGTVRSMRGDGSFGSTALARELTRRGSGVTAPDTPDTPVAAAEAGMAAAGGATGSGQAAAAAGGAGLARGGRGAKRGGVWSSFLQFLGRGRGGKYRTAEARGADAAASPSGSGALGDASSPEELQEGA